MIGEVWEKLLAKPKGGEWGASPWTIILSFLTCSVVLAVIDSTGCCLPRQKLKRADRIEWNVRIVSSIHAIVLVVGMLEAELLYPALPGLSLARSIPLQSTTGNFCGRCMAHVARNTPSE